MPPFSVCLLMLLLRKQNQRDKKKKRTFNCRIEREFSSSFPFSLPSCFAAECEWATVSVHSLIKHNDISLVFPTLYPLATLCFFFFCYLFSSQLSNAASSTPHSPRRSDKRANKKKKNRSIGDTLYYQAFALPVYLCLQFAVSWFIYLFFLSPFSFFFFRIKCAYRPTRRHKHTGTLRTNITTK